MAEVWIKDVEGALVRSESIISIVPFNGGGMARVKVTTLKSDHIVVSHEWPEEDKPTAQEVFAKAQDEAAALAKTISLTSTSNQHTVIIDNFIEKVNH